MLSNARLKKVICLQVQCYVYDRDGKLHDLSPLAKQSGAYKVTSNFYINVCQDIIPGIQTVYSVLVSVSYPKALHHLESDNLFRITIVVADWLG